MKTKKLINHQVIQTLNNKYGLGIEVTYLILKHNDGNANKCDDTCKFFLDLKKSGIDIYNDFNNCYTKYILSKI